jgi:hypothetical protein
VCKADMVPIGIVLPFYFSPSPGDGIEMWEAVALVTPSEVGVLPLPDGWGEWASAVKL